MKKLLCLLLTLFLPAAAMADTLTLPAAVKTIEAGAFAGDTSLDEVRLPPAVTSIGSQAFADSSVRRINLPSSLNSIADDAFDGCDELTAVVTKNSYAYQYCVDQGIPYEIAEFEYVSNGDGTCTITAYTGRSSVVNVPETLDDLTVTALAEGLFANMTFINEIWLPDAITVFPDYLCDGCTRLSTIEYSSYNGSTIEIGDYAFRNCTSLSYIAPSAEIIGEGTYQGCIDIKFISLGNTKTIGAYAFEGCTSVTEVYQINELEEIGSFAFHDCTSLEQISLTAHLTAIGFGAFEGCTSLSELSLPNDISFVGSGAFDANTVLKCAVGTTTEKTLKAGGYAYTLLIPYSYEDHGDGTCTITKYHAFDTELVIPSAIDNLKVVAIGEKAFRPSQATHHSFTSVIIPEGVTSIGNLAFANCHALSSVTLPDGLLSIGESAFDCCSISSINLPDSITTIGSWAFYTNELIAVDLPANLSSIGNAAFGYPLASITIESTNTSYKVVDNALYTIDGTKLILHPAGSSSNTFVVPEGVEIICASAFAENRTLATITLPSTLHAIENCAFSGTSNLAVINLPNELQTIGAEVFGWSGITSIIIPDSVTSIGRYAFGNCRSLTSVSLPDDLTVLNEGTFSWCTALTDIILPSDLTSIEYGAFRYCTSLETLTLPASLTSINEYAFQNCPNLTVTVTENSYAHQWCIDNSQAYVLAPEPDFTYTENTNGTITITGTILTDAEIVIPSAFEGKTVSTIGEGLLKDCTTLTRLVLSEGITTILPNAFMNCTSLEEVVFPESLGMIQSSAFSGCTALTEITLPKALNFIGGSVFSGCTGLKSVIMPQEEMYLFSSIAFNGCTGMTATVKYNSDAHQWCVDNGVAFVFSDPPVVETELFTGIAHEDGTLTITLGKTPVGDVEIPAQVDGKNVIAIERGAFAGSTGLTSVTLPSGLETIGDEAFSGCTALADVFVPSTVTSIGTDAFANCAPAMLLRTESDAAVTYAASNQLDYQADTTYRALLIAQSNYTSFGKLNAPPNDVAAFAQALRNHPGTPYQCSIKQDLTGTGLVTSIRTAFAGAKASDVSLLYFSGHGASGGMLVGIDSNYLSPTSLRNLLDAIPGRKIVIVDACYSGAIIGRSTEAGTPDDFANDFTSAFAVKTRSTLDADNYFVITAAHSTQQSVELGTYKDGALFYFGLFTRYLCDGLGYDYLGFAACDLLADADGNGVVSIEEAYVYAKTNASAKYSKQTAQVYPADCTWQGLVRN